MNEDVEELGPRVHILSVIAEIVRKGADCKD
jgi:hypothetical protein